MTSCSVPVADTAVVARRERWERPLPARLAAVRQRVALEVPVALLPWMGWTWLLFLVHWMPELSPSRRRTPHR